jgi:hypothetical protein
MEKRPKLVVMSSSSVVASLGLTPLSMLLEKE